MSEQSMTNFLNWARVKQPAYYREFANRISGDGLGDWTDIFKTAVTAVKDYRADKNVKKQLDINLERARQGQDPVDFSRSTPNQPYPAGLPQAPQAPYPVYNAPAQTGAQKNTVLVIAAAGLLGLLFFLRKGKK